jgi:hypothetical protein
VGCEFCYLGGRSDGEAAPLHDRGPLLDEVLARLRWDEVAVAVSEPVAPARPALEAIVRVAARLGRPVTVTTTMAVAASEPSLLAGVSRVSLSVDPRKGPVAPARIDSLARLLHRRGVADVVLIATLTTPEFAARLVEGGLLAAFVDLASVDKVALNALKPPPDWCDRAFWLRTLAALEPLLARALDSRLFLDCYVAARILGLGGCPARPDLSPATGGLAFRACVYQPAPDFVAASAEELATRLEGFRAPAECPFPIR